MEDVEDVVVAAVDAVNAVDAVVHSVDVKDLADMLMMAGDMITIAVAAVIGQHHAIVDMYARHNQYII